MSKLTYNTNDTGYGISFNNINLGDLVYLEDGFYHYFPINYKSSCISSWVLKDIANKLDELNKPYEEEIKKYFNSK